MHAHCCTDANDILAIPTTVLLIGRFPQQNMKQLLSYLIFKLTSNSLDVVTLHSLMSTVSTINHNLGEPLILPLVGVAQIDQLLLLLTPPVGVTPVPMSSVVMMAWLDAGAEIGVYEGGGAIVAVHALVA